MLKLNIDEKYMYYIRIAGVLIIITACVALMLGAINAVTADKIEENRIAEFMEAVDVIFPESDSIHQLDIAVESPVDVVYEVNKNNELIGYCIKVLANGFDGEIDLIVGVDISGTILGVKIVSHSETPGLGSRVADDEYLESYVGLSGTVKFKNGIDAVAGATVTSKAVLSGVNAALSVQGIYDNNENNYHDNGGVEE